MTPSDPASAAAPCFPCLEQPSRIVLSCKIHDNRLSSTKNGRVLASPRRSEREQWLVSMTESPTENSSASKNGQVVSLKSFKFGRWLAIRREDGEIVTVEDPSDAQQYVTRWRIQRHDKNGGVSITSVQEDGQEKLITCHHEENTVSITTAAAATSLAHNGNDDSSSSSSSWSMEFVTGELCFLSLGDTRKQIRCDLVGRLSLTDTCKGWEVWRLVEAGQGFVRIHSWMHSQFVLHSNDEGKVYAAVADYKEYESRCWDLWMVQKSPRNDGVVIQSVVHGKKLAVESVERTSRTDVWKQTLRLVTVDEPKQEESSVAVDENAASTSTNSENAVISVWQLEAAHSQRYTLAPAHDKNKSVGPFPYVTDNHRQCEEFTLEQQTDGSTVRLYSSKQDKYLGTNVDGGEVAWVDARDDSASLWSMTASPSGDGYMFAQNDHVLSFHDCDKPNLGRLCTVAIGKEGIVDNPKEEEYHRVVWRLDPCLPRAISSGKIKTFAIGTSAAVATTVAMPFAMAGVMGLLGAVGAEVGLFANIVAAGLTGAEAIASVGVVGATAALVFKESGDSFSLTASEHGDDEEESRAEEKPYLKRPFCAWRTW